MRIAVAPGWRLLPVTALAALCACGSTTGGGGTGQAGGAPAGGARGTGNAAGGGASSSSGAAAPAIQSDFSAQVKITGAVSATGSFVETGALHVPCVTAAQTGDGGRFPMPTTDQPVSGHAVVVQLAVHDYHGSDTYSIGSLTAPDANISVDQQVYHVVEATQASVTVDPDGAGTLTVSGLVSDGGQELGATISWTCAEEH